MRVLLTVSAGRPFEARLWTWTLIVMLGTTAVVVALYVITAGIRSNGYDGEGIRRFLAEIKEFKSIGGGTFSMDPDGQSIVPVALYQVKDVEKPIFEEIKP